MTPGKRNLSLIGNLAPKIKIYEPLMINPKHTSKLEPFVSSKSKEMKLEQTIDQDEA